MNEPNAKVGENKLKKGWERFSSLNGAYVFIALVIYIIAVSIIAPFVTGGRFLTYTNVMNVFRQQSYIGILGAAMTFVVITGNIDLSVGNLLTMLAVICAQLTQRGPVFAIVVTLLLGLACGALNGALVAGIKLNAFITTIAMGSVYGALTLVIAPGSTVRVEEPIFNTLGSGFVFRFIPVSVLIVMGFIVILGIILSKTTFGCRLRAIGSNPVAARFSGIRTQLYIFINYCLSGFAAAIAAILYIARSVAANPQLTSGAELQVVMAVVLGGCTIKGGKGSVWGTIIGFLFMGFVTTGFTFLGLNTYMQRIILGVVLIIALAMDAAKERGGKSHGIKKQDA